MLPSTALPAAQTGGAGSITRGDGTGWQTFDAKASPAAGTVGQCRTELSFGPHGDRYELDERAVCDTTDWISGAAARSQHVSRGKTETSARYGCRMPGSSRRTGS